MKTHVINLTLDAEEFLSSTEFLEGIPEILKTKFNLFDAFLEFIGFKFNVTTAIATGDCNVLLNVSDGFRDFVSALWAGNIQ